MSQVQRDISESLERAKALKAKRDSVARLVEEKRFKKTGYAEEIENAEKKEELEKVAQNPVPQSKHETSVNSNTTASDVAVTIVSGGSASIPVERFFTTNAMDGLTPLGKQTVFKVGDPVFAYAGIHAPQAEQVRLEWIDPSGKLLPPSEYVDIQSNTGVNGYRIYKQRQFQKEGKYEVRLYNGSGELIGKTEFTISGDY